MTDVAASAGREGPVQWRVFMRAMAEEIDSLAGPGERDDMLRGVGRRMARMVPLPPVQTLQALEIEINDVLGAYGWGSVALQLDAGETALLVTHVGLPRMGSLGSPAGAWLGAMLEGLYDSWFAQQPGSKQSLSSKRAGVQDGPGLVLRYARQ